MNHEQDLPHVTRDMYGVPVKAVTSGELVPFGAQQGAVKHPLTALVVNQHQAEVGVQERLAAERDRLLGLCRSLRASHRCPGRCVFSGELRETGLQHFRRAVLAQDSFQEPWDNRQ